MVEISAEFPSDPWAWLHTADAEDHADYSRFRVLAGILPISGEPFTTGCREAVEAQDVAVDEIVDTLSPDTAGDWIWLLPDDVQPASDALAALLDRVRREPDTAVVGGLLIEPRRRGAGTLVSEWAHTISRTGRLRPLTEPGELYQGQLPAIRALGVPAGGMLVRGDVWRFLGGVNTGLPRGYWGLDLGWRANLAGYRVLAEPAAQFTNHAEPDDPVEDRAAGLTLVYGHTRTATRWLAGLWLSLACLLSALGYLLGKDPGRAGEELRGWSRWSTSRRLRRTVIDQVASLPVTPAYRQATRALRPVRWSGTRRVAEQVAARLIEWVQTFTGRSSGISLDEMTGDDFAATGSSHYRLPLVATGAVVLAVGAVIAGRSAFGSGWLTGPQLLAAPGQWTALLDAYLQPVPGQAAVAGAPWTAIAAVFALLTLGQPDWLVTGLFIGAIPIAWLATFRLLRQLLGDLRLAGVVALAYALAPALLGGLNAGALGTVAIAVLLPILGYSCWNWLQTEEWSWRRAGSVAFWVMLVTALSPTLWLLGVPAAILTGLRAGRVRAWAQWTLVLAVPALLLVGPWGSTILRYPGRLLTGIEPVLNPAAPSAPWQVLVGATIPGAAPLWLAVGFFGIAWIAAIVGAARRPSVAGPVLGVAAAAAVIAMVLIGLAVEVLPGQSVRPQAGEWQLVMVAALVLAAGLGLDQMLDELRDSDLGLRHFASLGLSIASIVALLAGTGWWVMAGQTGVTRNPLGSVPAFVRNAQLSPTPGRTLALSVDGDQVRWALLEGDFPRLGDAERGLAFGGDPAATQLAAAVATRLVGESADEQLVPDLISLGVAHVVLTGGDSAQRTAINNVPGLGLGTGDAGQFVWPVPDSGIVMVGTDDARLVLGPGVEVPPGGTDRALRLAEPADARWAVSIADQRLSAADHTGIGARFDAGARSGTLSYRLIEGPRWWAWVQLSGLIVLAVLAAPSLTRRDRQFTPRRIADEDES